MEFHLPKKAEIGTLVKEKVLNYCLVFSVFDGYHCDKKVFNILFPCCSDCLSLETKRGPSFEQN